MVPAVMISTVRSLLLAVTAAPIVAFPGDEMMRTVRVYDDHASLEVPADWSEIPPELLEFYSIRSAEASGGVVAETYQHGYRKGNPEADFAPPQILIQIRESGRISYRELLRLPSVEAVRSAAEELDARSGPFLRDLAVGEASFDPNSFSLRLTNTLDLSYEGRVIVKSASFLTERGTFTVHCYALLHQQLRMSPIFDRVLSSVRFDDALRYRPRFSDRLPHWSALLSYTIAAALAVAALLFHLIRRRRLKT